MVDPRVVAGESEIEAGKTRLGKRRGTNMKTAMRWTTFVLAAAAVLGCGQGKDADSRRSAVRRGPVGGPAGLVGKPLPAFQMTDLAGKRLTNEGLKGKVVLIDF